MNGTTTGRFLFCLCLGVSSLCAAPDVSQFFATYCIDCHGPDKAKGKIRLDTLSPAMKTEKDAELWHRVLESLQFGEMPSDKAKKFPTRAESRMIEGWITTTLAQRGDTIEDKSVEEGYGNLVPHELLFSPKERARTVDVGARIWRISPETLASMLKNAGGGVSRTNPFELDQPHGNFTDYKGKYLLNSIMTEQVAELALRAAESQTADNRHERHIKGMIDRGQTREQALQELLKRHHQTVLRRAPSEKDLERLTALMKRVDDELGEPNGLRAAYASIILTPESIFRYEGTGAVKNETGLTQLTNSELAHALAFALTDRPPEKALLLAFEESQTSTRETLREQAKILLDEHRYAAPRLLQFFQEYFDYEKANDIFKDRQKGHAHWAPALVNDLNQLITHVLEEDRQVFRTLLTTSKFFVHVNSYKDYHSPLAYNLPHDFKPTRNLVSLPKEQRRGVLTHPAWLVAHSGNFDNDPIHRGLWIRKKLLGGNVPDVPITVDAKLPDEPTWTLRKRLEVTEADQCYKCHSKMNPLGLPFEQWDHFGRYQLDEILVSTQERTVAKEDSERLAILDAAEQTAPVVATGAVLNSGVPELDGPITDPFSLIEKLAASEHVEQVFVRHVFRFFMGRNETLGDARTLQDAHQAYVDHDGSMRALVVSLLSSDSFVYRANKSGEAKIDDDTR